MDNSVFFTIFGIMIKIRNFTSYTTIAEKINLILDIMSIKDIDIDVIERKNLSNKDFDFYGLIVKGVEQNKYQIFLSDKISKNMINDVLSHEMIHLNQMYRGDLSISLETNTITWKGKTFTPPYDRNSEWEIEAFSCENKYKKLLKNGTK